MIGEALKRRVSPSSCTFLQYSGTGRSPHSSLSLVPCVTLGKEFKSPVPQASLFG